MSRLRISDVHPGSTKLQVPRPGQLQRDVQAGTGLNDNESRGGATTKGRFGKTGGRNVPDTKKPAKDEKPLALSNFGGIPNTKFARDIAKFYYDSYGLVVIPVPVGQKAPVIKWAGIQSYTDAVAHFRINMGTSVEDVSMPMGVDDCNYACLCGPSNVVVVDFDDKELAERHKIDTLTVRTPKGTHYYIRLIDSTVGNMSFHSQGCPVDIRGKGGIAILPPSIGVSPYVLDDTYPIRSFPYEHFSTYLKEMGAFAQSLDQPKNEPGWFVKEINTLIEQGARDETCTKLAGYLLNGNLTPEDVCEILHLWAREMTIPPFMDVEKCVYSIARKEARNETSKATDDAFEDKLRAATNSPDNPFA